MVRVLRFLCCALPLAFGSAHGSDEPARYSFVAGADINTFMTQFSSYGHDLLFDIVAAMITSNYYFHISSSPILICTTLSMSFAQLL